MYQTAAVASLFGRLVDDAGLFPPESLTMAAAVDRHVLDARRGSPVLTHRFVCPARRLSELQETLGSAQSLTVSVTTSGEDEELLPLSAVLRDGRFRVSSVEFAPGRSFGAVQAFLGRLSGGAAPFDVYVEQPFGERLPAAAQSLVDHGWNAKLRCGGIRRPLFPTAAELADALAIIAAHDLAFKATAGLHHALPYTDPVTGFRHHGFLTLVLAVAHAAGGADFADIGAALQITDPARIQHELAGIDVDLASKTRGLFRSYGSCSTRDPLDDLLRLGLVTSHV